MKGRTEYPDVIVRGARRAEAAAIARLHAATLETAWDKASITKLMAEPTTIAILATIDADRLAGFALGRIAADEFEIMSVAVAAEYRRSGIGRRLVLRMLAEAGARGVHRAFLEVAETNTPAATLYATCGFDVCGRRRGYYTHADGSSEDALVLARELAPQ